MKKKKSLINSSLNILAPALFLCCTGLFLSGAGLFQIGSEISSTESNLLIAKSALLLAGSKKTDDEPQTQEVQPLSKKNVQEHRNGPNYLPETLRSHTRGWSTNWNMHTIALNELQHGGPPRDGIPSIDKPTFESVEDTSAWLAPNEPVIFTRIEGDARAYPLQILIWHEIVNDRVGGIPVLVTFCPLCNASIIFNRQIEMKEYEFGTSGLLRNSDLVMYDRLTESLWQQLTGEAIVGDLAGKRLDIIPSSIVSFKDVSTNYPDGKVLSRETGYHRTYGKNPYPGYDTIDQNPFLFKGELDSRLKPMERVVAVSITTEEGENIDIAYPFRLLSLKGVINDSVGGIDLVLFHTPGTSSALSSASVEEGTEVGASGVFLPFIKGKKIIFLKDGNYILDAQTKSRWNIFGLAIEGPLKGEELTPIPHGDFFWFVWAAFKPNSIVY